MKRGRSKGKAIKLLDPEASPMANAKVVQYGHISKSCESTLVSSVKTYDAVSKVPEKIRRRCSIWLEPESFEAKKNELVRNLGEDLYAAIATGNFSKIDRIKAAAETRDAEDPMKQVRLLLLRLHEERTFTEGYTLEDVRCAIVKAEMTLPDDRTLGRMIKELGIPKPSAARRGPKPKAKN